MISFKDSKHTTHGKVAVRIGSEIRLIQLKDVVYFYSKDKSTFVKTRESDYRLSKCASLQSLMTELDGLFLMARSGVLVSKLHIRGISTIGKGEWVLHFRGAEEKILLSRRCIKQIKSWIHSFDFV